MVMRTVPLYFFFGLALATAIIVRALMGAAYRGASAGGRAFGRLLLIFGVVMWLVFLWRIIQFYRVR
jgi:hypothetical protein